MSHTTSIRNSPIKSVTALRKAITRLQEQGINVSIEENAVPRMYYQQQMAKHVKAKQDQAERAGQPHNGLRFHDNPDECDFVIRLQDSYYDIGLIYNKHGELEAFFDDYNHASYSVPATQTGKGPIRDYLGAKFDGQIEHWSGEREAGEQQLHSVGKLLQNYSLCATVEQAEAEGNYVSSCEFNDKGEVVLYLDC